MLIIIYWGKETQRIVVLHYDYARDEFYVGEDVSAERKGEVIQTMAYVVKWEGGPVRVKAFKGEVSVGNVTREAKEVFWGSVEWEYMFPCRIPVS